MHESTIHRVYVRSGLYDPCLMSVPRFLAIEAATRSRMIVEGLVEFLDERGGAVSLDTALAQLRRARHGGRVPVPASVMFGHEPPAENEDERRRHARVPFVRPMRLVADASRREQTAVAQNLSPGGIMFRTRERLAPGARVVVGWAGAYGVTGDTWKWAVVRRVSEDPPERASLFPVQVAVEFEQPVPKAA